MKFYCLINLWEKNITFASAYILFLDLDPYIIIVTEGSHVARMSYSLINGMGKGKLFSTGPSELLWKNLFGKKTHEDVKLNSRYCFRNMYVQVNLHFRILSWETAATSEKRRLYSKALMLPYVQEYASGVGGGQFSPRLPNPLTSCPAINYLPVADHPTWL